MTPSDPGTGGTAGPAGWAGRHGYLLLGLALATLFLAMFAVAEQLRVPVLTGTRPFAGEADTVVALVGVALLVADVLLPVPASGVMIALGAAVGVVPGSLLALAGGTGATLTAYFVGRSSRPLVNRLVSDEQQRRGADLVERHGTWAIVLTRPVPVLAETVAIIAGSCSAMPWWRVAIAGALGNVVPAVAYAAAGAYATTYVDGVAVFVGVVALSGLVWMLQRRST